MNHIMAVCDGEEPYASRLVDYLNTKEGFPFDVRHFSDMEKLRDFSQIQNIEVALVALEFYKKAREDPLIEQVILLQDDEAVGETQIKGVWKYQSCENIMKEILHQLSENPIGGNWIHRKTSLRIIGFYTPIKRSLQTSFALTMGQLLAKKEKVLYLNLEGYSGFSRLFRFHSQKDISDLLFCIQNNEQGMNYLIGSMVEHIGGLDLLPPMQCQMDLVGVTKNEWLKLFSQVEKYTDYDYLLLDLSDSIQGIFDILRQCSRVYTLTLDDGVAMAKIEQYEKMLQQCQYEDVIKKTNKCKLPQISHLPKNFENLCIGEMAVRVREMIKEDFYGER